MAFGGNSVRAFRPSRMVSKDSWDCGHSETEKDRQLNIERYAQRVRDGVPLFEESAEKPKTDTI